NERPAQPSVFQALRQATARAGSAWRINAAAYIVQEEIMPVRVCLIIGIIGLNICLLPGQESLWEQHLAKGRQFRAQGSYKEAEAEYLAAVQAASVFGPESPKLARCWNNLGALYQDQGRYDEAEKLYRQATAVWERAPGSMEDLAATLNNLGVVE